MGAVTRVDTTGVTLAALLAVVPLLPTGPTHAGLPRFAYVELAVPALVLLWAVARYQARGRAAHPWPLHMRAWHITVAVIGGAAIFGTIAENRVSSPVFLLWLRNSSGDLFWPMNQASHPLYPLRVALTFIEGWLVFVLVADLCRRAPAPRQRARIALAGWFLGFALVSAFALAQYVTRFDLHPYWVDANPAIVRAHSTLDDPNALGAYMALGIGLLAGLLRLGDARRRLLWGALFGIGTVGLAATMSRAALGAAIIVPLCVFSVGPRPVTRWQRTLRTAARATLALLILGVLGSAIFRMLATEQRRTQPDNEAQLVIKTFDPRESTDSVLRGRLVWWGAAVEMVREKPMTGIGLGRFPGQMESYGGGPAQENTHNLFLQLFAEAGIPGGVAFSALCAMLCLAFGRLLRRSTDPRNRAMALGGLIGTIAFLMTLVTGHTLLLPSGQLLFSSYLAVVAGIASSDVPTPRAGRGKWRAISAAGVLCLALWYPIAAVVQGIAPPSGGWGYAWGLYPEEHTAGGIGYRWTSDRALLDIPVPPDTTTLEIPVAAPSPMRNGAPTILRITAGGTTREIPLVTADVQTISIPLADAGAVEDGRMLVDVVVRPTYIPSQSLPTTDDRVLGVQLLRPRFVTRTGG